MAIKLVYYSEELDTEIEVRVEDDLDIEELKHFLQENGLVDVPRILLHDFGAQLLLKT